jgi:hypothetical protein
VPDGDLNELRPLVNLPDDDSWVLFVGSILNALRPRGPYFITEVVGPQGSAKSTLCKFHKQLIDPSQAPVRSEPREIRDLMIATSNGWLVSFDNLSSISRWFSDALCRLSTGGGFATRELYTDTDEVIFDVQRPAVLNGIEELVLRGDLLSRTISLSLPLIDSTARQTEADLLRQFDAIRPQLLGALYTAVSMALKDVDSVVLAELPRLADAVTWVTAAEPAVGWPPGTFLAAYNRQTNRLAQRAVDADLLGALLIKLVETGDWTGTATELLERLVEMTPTHSRRQLPATPSSLGQKLRRLAPDLRSQGIEVGLGSRDGHEGRRLITLRRVDRAVSPVSAVSTLSDRGKQ